MRKIDRKIFKELIRVMRKYVRGNTDVLDKKNEYCDLLGEQANLSYLTFGYLSSVFVRLEITDETIEKVMNLLGFELVDYAIEENTQSISNKEEYIKQLIKKDTPLPVYLEGDGYSDGELVIDTAICENCGEHYEIDYEHYRYCPNCGQKLDWSEVE